LYTKDLVSCGSAAGAIAKLKSKTKRNAAEVLIVIRMVLRAGEIIDVESVAIRDGGFGCEGRYGAE
jgi:hypothetical protein